jgi:hypothetical protein
MLSNTSYDIDLSKLEDTDDPEQVISMIGQAIDGDSDFKILPARQWTENFLYFAGMRDLASRFTTGTVIGNSLATNIPLAGQAIRKRHIAKTFKAIQVQASNVTRQRPAIKVWPEDEEEQAYKKAKMANMVLDYMWEEDCEEDMYYAAILWALMTPAVARKDYMSYEYNRARIWPVETQSMIPTAKVDPQTGQQILVNEPTMVQDKDDEGNPIFEQHPWHRSDLVPATRLIFNPTATWRHDIDFVGDTSIRRVGWIEQNYGITKEGYHPENIGDIKPGLWKYTPIMALEAAFQNLSFGSARTFRNFAYGAMPLVDGVVHAHFFIKPSPNYPEGREIAIANGVLLYDGVSRYYREVPSTVWHPYSFLCYERNPARLWGSTYAEKLTDLNRAYDQARMEFEQQRRTFSKPKLMLPTGAGIDRDIVTGSEEVWRYNPYAADGGKPAYLTPPQMSSTLIDDIKFQQQEFVEISGVTEIMQGIRPQGVTTYRGLEVLREESSNSANNFIRMYEAFMQRSQFNKLECVRKSMTRPDENFTKALRVFKKMNQYITDVDIKDFIGSDLAGFVKIEPYSTIGKSRLAAQDKYMQLAGIGVLGDIVNDPDLNTEFKRKMDVVGFDAPRNRQVEYARHENQLMMQADKMQQIINPPVQEWHDHPIHIREIETVLLDPTIFDSPDKQMAIQSLMAHRGQHMQIMAQKIAEQMAQQQAMGQPPPGAEQPQKPGNGGSQPKQNEGMLFGNEQGFVSNNMPQLA